MVIAQVRRGSGGNIPVRCGGGDHHDDLRCCQQVFNVVCHHFQFSKTVQAAGIYQVYALPFRDDLHV